MLTSNFDLFQRGALLQRNGSCAVVVVDESGELFFVDNSEIVFILDVTSCDENWADILVLFYCNHCSGMGKITRTTQRWWTRVDDNHV